MERERDSRKAMMTKIQLKAERLKPAPGHALPVPAV